MSTRDADHRPAKDWLAIVVVGAILFFTNLGATRLWDEDEAYFSRAAAEMLERGDWVTPYFNGAMFGHKPPVMYWCQMVGYQLFGSNEFAARFFSAIFGIGTLLVTYDLGRTLFNRRVGLWGAIALGSCINFAVIARAATPDSYLTFFCTLALLVLVRATGRGRDTDTWSPTLPPSWSAYALAYAVIGMAVLVKGPLIGGIVPMAVWGMFLLIEQKRTNEAYRAVTPSRRHPVVTNILNAFRLFAPTYFFKTVWRMRPLTAVAMILLVAGPWYAWVGIRTDGEFLREFFFKHNFGRATQAMDSHSGPIFYYLIAVCIGTFPWCVLLGPALGNLLRAIRRQNTTSSAYTLVACWAGVWIGLLSLASTKLPSYIVPCYPALALTFAALVDGWLTAADPSVCKRWLRAAWGTTGAVGVGFLIVVPIVTRIYLDGEWTPALVGIVPLVAAVIGLWFSEHGAPSRSLATLAIAGVVFCTALLGFAVLPVDRHQNSQLLTDFVREHSAGKPNVAAYKYLPPSLVYYNGAPIKQMETAEDIPRFFQTHPQDAFLVTTRKIADGFSSALPTDIQVLMQDRYFLRTGEVVLLGRSSSIETAKHRSLTKPGELR